MIHLQQVPITGQEHILNHVHVEKMELRNLIVNTLVARVHAMSLQMFVITIVVVIQTVLMMLLVDLKH
jgi:hypothetical protein